MSFKRVFRGYDPNEVDKYIADNAAKEQQIRTAQKERIDELSDENYALRQQVKQYQTDEQAISKSLIASQHLAQELKFDAERYSDLVLSRAKIFYATWRAYSRTLIASLSEEEVRAFNALQKKIEDVINAYEGKDVAKEMEEKEARQDRVAATVSQAAAERSCSELDETAALPHTFDAKLPEQAPTQRHETEQNSQSEAVVEPQQAQPKAEPQEEQMPLAVQSSAQPPLDTPQSDISASAQSESKWDDSRLTEEEKWRRAREVVDVTPSEKTMGIYSNPISKVEQASGQVIDLRELTKTDMSLEELCAELGLIEKKNQ